MGSKLTGRSLSAGASEMCGNARWGSTCSVAANEPFIFPPPLAIYQALSRRHALLASIGAGTTEASIV